MKTLTAFVAMPYSEDFDNIFNFGISPIARLIPGWDIHVLRADTARQQSTILWLHVRELMDNADLSIIDVTGYNPNVMMELGFASAISKDIIIISQEKPTLSDLQGHIYIEYSPVDLRKLQRDLLFKVTEILETVSEHRGNMRGDALEQGRSTWKNPLPIHRPDIPSEATKERDMGFLARERGNMREALQHFSNAKAICPTYWEVLYDMAFCHSYLKEENNALEMADFAITEAIAKDDYEIAWKAHNLKSGIYKRTCNYPKALEEIRAAYDYSHMQASSKHAKPHIVPIKNRAALEFLHGDKNAFERLLTELRNHPDVQSALPELEKEIGRHSV